MNWVLKRQVNRQVSLEELFSRKWNYSGNEFHENSYDSNLKRVKFELDSIKCFHKLDETLEIYRELTNYELKNDRRMKNVNYSIIREINEIFLKNEG